MRGLVNYYLDAGPGIVTGGGRNIRRYTVGEEPDFVKYEETAITESRIWVALTLAAAQNQAELNEQPRLENGERDPDATYSWTYREDQRTIGSYILQRDYEKKITNAVEFAPTPNLTDAPQLSLSGRTSIQNVTDAGLFPGDVTITKSNPNARLFYRVRVAQRVGSGNGSLFGASFQSEAYSETTASSVVVNVNAPETPETYIRTANESSGSYGTWRRVVRIDAYDQITITNTQDGQPITVTSPTITRYYHSSGLSVSKPTLGMNPAGRTSMQHVTDFNEGGGTWHDPSKPTLPYTINLTASSGTIEASIVRGVGTGGQYAVSWPSDSYSVWTSITIPSGISAEPRVLTLQSAFQSRIIFRVRIRSRVVTNAGEFLSSTHTRYFHSDPSFG